MLKQVSASNYGREILCLIALVIILIALAPLAFTNNECPSNFICRSLSEVKIKAATAYNLKSLRSAKNQVNIWGHGFS
jgi:hypothetical protein